MIGIGVITCNRNDFFKKCINSIHEQWYQYMVIVNDGSCSINTEKQNCKIINNKKNLGVCKSKNIALKYLIKDQECEYVFLVEDDMLFTGNVFEKYIQAHKHTNIHHFSFGYHGPANRQGRSHGPPTARKIIDYGNGIKIALNMHSVGAVCFYTKEVIDKVGYFDEEFDKNNFEHVDHSYRISKAGLGTPYWWWADIADSFDYIKEQACSEENTSIRRGNDWQKKIVDSAMLFKRKHGYMPAWDNHVPDLSFSDVKKFLRNLKK